jgi:hypothetical protein
VSGGTGNVAGFDVPNRGGGSGALGEGARGGVANGGRAGRGGAGGTAGTAEPNECPVTTESFCDSIGFGDCPTFVGGRWRAPCIEDALFYTYQACDDGSARFRWNVAGENDVEVTFDDQGKVTYGLSNEYAEPECKVGDDEQPTGACRICTICEYNESGEGGGGGEGGAGDQLCTVTSDGFLLPPE